MKDSLRIYGVKDAYIKYLSQYQEHLFLHEGSSSGRKYIGVVLEINKFSYFAPLSSFKRKHKKMKEGVDFIKIKDYAVININNMIPVPKGQLVELNINMEKDSHYRFLLQAESREINKQKYRIRKNAEIVYNHKKRNRNLTPLAKRTNDFEMLEKLSRVFCNFILGRQRFLQSALPRLWRYRLPVSGKDCTGPFPTA